MADAPSIHAAMSQVMADIGAVDKADWNDFQKFKFRGIDTIQNAVYGPMCKHGVFVVPSVISADYAEVKTSQNKPARQATLTMRFTFYGPAGDSVECVTVGEAMDSADKATNKAMAVALKYALIQSFCIPTEGQDDADAHHPERGGQSTNGQSTVDISGLDELIVTATEAGVDANYDAMRAHAHNSADHLASTIKSLQAKLDEHRAATPTEDQVPF